MGYILLPIGAILKTIIFDRVLIGYKTRKPIKSLERRYEKVHYQPAHASS